MGKPVKEDDESTRLDSEFDCESQAGDNQKEKLKRFTRSYLRTLYFHVVTFVIIAELIINLWQIAIYGINHHYLFLALACMFLALPSVLSAYVYLEEIREKKPFFKNYKNEDSLCNSLLWIAANIPLPFGLIWARFKHGFEGEDDAERRSYAFTRAKLVSSLLQSAPLLCLNIIVSLVNFHQLPMIQFIAAILSFTSMLLGVVSSDISRKKNPETIKASQVLCIVVYRTLMLSARILAMAHFSYYFGVYSFAMILPHFLIIQTYFILAYKEAWKVGFTDILLSGIYSILDYIPIKNMQRKEGEIVLYYIIQLIENTFLVTWIYVFPPTIHYPIPDFDSFAAHVRVAFYMQIYVLCASIIGIFVMLVYYWCIHTSSETIRDNSLIWITWPEPIPPQVRSVSCVVPQKAKPDLIENTTTYCKTKKDIFIPHGYTLPLKCEQESSEESKESSPIYTYIA